MSGFGEPLPGLLDDPLLSLPDLPPLFDFHIAPLRDPVPSYSGDAPLLLEPATTQDRPAASSRAAAVVPSNATSQQQRILQTSSKPAVVPRDGPKTNLAISELVDASPEAQFEPPQLPSYISLAVVEKSPVQSSAVDAFRARKRSRLDSDVEAAKDGYIQLPQPSNKQENAGSRPVSLLPAMLNGLHEPPPSAALLPSMELGARGLSFKSDSASQGSTLRNKPEHKTAGRPPEKMLNSPKVVASQIQCGNVISAEAADTGTNSAGEEDERDITAKGRRVPKKWTMLETEQLMQGVQKYGIGKWKQILKDSAFTFNGRSTVDLKDRFRVCMPDVYKDRKLSSKLKQGLELPTLSLEAGNTRHSPVPESPPSGNVSRSPATLSGASDPSVSQSTVSAATPVNAPTSRRKRHPWTAIEDSALLAGVQKHGFQWTLIHDDADLNLQHRRATDLRDRIRNKYPAGYRYAETAPLKSERHAPSTSGSRAMEGEPRVEPVIRQTKATAGDPEPPDAAARRTGASYNNNNDAPSTFSQEQTIAAVASTAVTLGTTLPSLALDDSIGDSWNWADATLPPML